MSVKKLEKDRTAHTILDASLSWFGSKTSHTKLMHWRLWPHWTNSCSEAGLWELPGSWRLYPPPVDGFVHWCMCGLKDYWEMAETRMWDLVIGSRPLGVCPWMACWDSELLFPPSYSSLTLLAPFYFTSSYSRRHNALLHCRLPNSRASD